MTIPLCCFWDPQLHIWKFLELLSSHSNVAMAGLQVLSRGQCQSFQRTEPGAAWHRDFSGLLWRLVSILNFLNFLKNTIILGSICHRGDTCRVILQVPTQVQNVMEWGWGLGEITVKACMCNNHVTVRVTDLRTAPVLRQTFSVTILRICSRSCCMLRGTMNRNGGQSRSPLRKTLSKRIKKHVFYRCPMEV